MEKVNKETIEKQVKQLEVTGNIAKAKAWWHGLNPAQKALVIGLTIGGSCAAGYAAYGLSIGATAGQSFWAAVIMGSLTTLPAYAIAHSYHSTAGNDVPDEEVITEA